MDESEEDDVELEDVLDVLVAAESEEAEDDEEEPGPLLSLPE